MVIFTNSTGRDKKRRSKIAKSQNRKFAHENWYFRETYNNPEQESQIAVYSNTLWYEGSEFLKGENFEKELTGNLRSVSNTEIFNKEIKSAANLVTIVAKYGNINNVVDSKNFSWFQRLLKVTILCL